MSDYKNDKKSKASPYEKYDFKGKSKPASKKSTIVFNTVLYCISALLVATGIIMLIREGVLSKNNETDGLHAGDALSEVEFYEAYPEATSYDPPVPPVDDIYSMIPIKFHFVERDHTCNIICVGIEENSAMGTVDSAQDVGWLSQAPYVIPGDVGNAVISGHNLWSGEAGSFSLLKKVTVGEQVAVEFNVHTPDGKHKLTRYFEVAKKYECPYNDPTPMKTQDITEPVLTLITCLGDWDTDLGQSKTRVVVICKPCDD